MARYLRLAAVLGVVLAIVGSSGCAYLQKRWNDAWDFSEGGITVTEEPQFGLYMGFFNLVEVGYARVDGTLHGWGHRQWGAMPFRGHATGYLVTADEQFGYASDFNPADPNSPAPWRAGLVGLWEGPPPTSHETANCPKLFHFGRVGLHLNCHFLELLDFWLGWTTLDIMNDDALDRPKTYERGQPAAPAAASRPSAGG